MAGLLDELSPEQADDLGYFILYDRFRQWLEAWEAEKDERDRLLEKLSKMAGVEKKSVLALMLLTFVAGADVASEIIDNISSMPDEKKKSPASEETLTGQATH